MVGTGMKVTGRRLLRNFYVLFLSSVLGQLLYLVALVHLARVFGPGPFGVWSLAQAWMMYVLRAGEVGLEPIGIRSIASGGGEACRPVVSNVLGIRAALAVGLYLVMILFAWIGVFPSSSEQLVLIFALALFPTAFILEWVFEAHQSVVPVGATRILKGALFAGLVLLFTAGADQIQEAAYYYVLALSVSVVVVGVTAFRRYPLVPLRFSASGQRELLRASLPVGAATLLTQYTLFAGTIFAGYMVSQDQLGIYSAGHRLVIFLWAYGIVSSNRVILPRLTQLFKESRDQFARFVKRYIRVLALVALGMVIAALTGGEAIIMSLYGSRFGQSVEVFQILSVALAVAITRSVLEVGLIAAGRQVLVMRGMIGLALLYTVLTYVGLEIWGVNGAAGAAVIAELCYALYLGLVFGFVGPVQLVLAQWKVLVVALAVIVFLSVVNLESPALLMATGLLLYGGLLYLVGVLKKEDLQLLLGALGVRRSSGKKDLPEGV